MGAQLHLDILFQPDDTTCGPTCLHAIYRYYKDRTPLETVIRDVRSLETGGTVAAHLGCDALRRGYRAAIYVYNLSVWDPTWFTVPGVDLAERLRAQLAHKADPKLAFVTHAYLEFLALGGQVRFAELTPKLIRRYLDQGVPVLAGLNATYLYRCAREHGPRHEYDDVRGEAMGHFVVLVGYDKEAREVLVADPHRENPAFESRVYKVGMDRLIGSIFLGVMTYDATLLVVQPRDGTKGD